MREMIKEGYLMKKCHDDLYLLNYTRKCTYEKKWNAITLKNRGNVYEMETDKIIAKTFPKFFNLVELPIKTQKQLLSRDDYRCYEKLDGSLGIIYNYDDEWRINTRGSFKSKQSKEAVKILKENYDLSDVQENITILAEIIYPKNRIVIDYGDKRELILISAYNRETEKELPRKKVEELSEMTGMPIVKEYDLTFDAMFEFQEKDDLSKEGFVVRFSDGTRIKIKSKKYLSIARILSNLTPLRVWENMVCGKVNQAFLEEVPEEFREELEEMKNKLEKHYNKLMIEIQNEFDLVMDKYQSRKEIGLAKGLKHKGCMFSLMDGKNNKVDDYVMKRIRPDSNEMSKK